MRARLGVSDLVRLALAWAIGSRLLPGLAATPDFVSGVDPLAPYAAHAPWALLRAMQMPSAPDIYVNSAVDLETLEVSAFEGLVGSHGGLGGRQDRGLGVLVSMLVRLGQRSHLPRPAGMAHQ